MTEFDLEKMANASSWLCDTELSGAHGTLCVKLSLRGKKEFYFRYYTKKNKRVRLFLGVHDRRGLSGLTLNVASKRAKQLSSLHEAGITNVREYLQDRVASV